MADVPVDLEAEIEGETGDAKAIEGVLGISQTNPSSSCTGSFDRSLTGQNSKCPEKSTEDKSDPTFSQLNRIQKNKGTHNLGVLGKKFFDDKIPLKKKLRWLKRYANIQDDGTVQFEVPGDIKPQSLDFGTGVRYNGYTDKEDAEKEDAPALPPLQIVMLIVGTRGDVQPFVAIGKRLQNFFLGICLRRCQNTSKQFWNLSHVDPFHAFRELLKHMKFKMSMLVLVGQ